VGVEEEGNAPEEELPGGIQASVIEVSEAADGEGEVAGIADGAVEEVGYAI